MKKNFIYVFICWCLIVPLSVAIEKTTITVSHVSSHVFIKKYKSVGLLQSRERAKIKARVSGTVKKINVHLGQVVIKGDALIEIHNPTLPILLSNAKEKLAMSKDILAEKKMITNIHKQLLKIGATSKLLYSKEIEQVKQAESDVKKATNNILLLDETIKHQFVAAPINGGVSKIWSVAGEHVEKGQHLIELINNNALMAVLPYSETNLSVFKPGQPVHIQSTNSDKYFDSYILAMKPEINKHNRSLDVIVHFDHDGGWHSGMSVYATVSLKSKHKAIFVPEHSLVLRSKGQVVYVIENNIAYERSVETGYRSDDGIEITKGLKPGEVIAIEGAGFLSHKAPVRIIKKSHNHEPS